PAPGRFTAARRTKSCGKKGQEGQEREGQEEVPTALDSCALWLSSGTSSSFARQPKSLVSPTRSATRRAMTSTQRSSQADAATTWTMGSADVAATMEGRSMTTKVALDTSPTTILQSLRGRILDARIAYPEVLHVELTDEDGGLWRFATQDSTFEPSDPSG